MTVGPALASLLDYVDFKVWGIPIDYCTGPGWLLGLAWSIYLFLVLMLFKEPKKPSLKKSEFLGYEVLPSTLLSSDKEVSQNSSLSDPLLLNLKSDRQEEECLVKHNMSNHTLGSLQSVLKELTLPVQILLVNYFTIKFASEMLISEATLITGYYFDWSASKVGIFLGVLGLTVLPSSAVVANYISNRFEERAIVFWTLILIAIGVLGILCYCSLIKYTEAQYITASVILFISTNVLEGVDMSLLAKVMSPRLSQGLFNCGFLSTEAGTIARAIADGLITLVGKVGMEHLLNYTMLPTLVLVVVTLILTWLGYYSLY